MVNTGGASQVSPVASLSSATSVRGKRATDYRVRFSELVSVVPISPVKKISRPTLLPFAIFCALLVLVLFCFQTWSAVRMASHSIRTVQANILIPVAPLAEELSAVVSAVSSTNYTFSLLTVIAWPSQRDEEDMLTSAGKPLDMKVTRFFQSVISHSECQLNIIVFTNSLGEKNVQKIWDSLSWRGQTTLTLVLVDKATVHAWTKNELVPRGASSSFEYRIWHWPKFWLKRILESLPNRPRFVLMVDVDGLVLKPLCEPASKMFEHMVTNKKCFAGVPEPIRSKDVVRTINTGLLLVDLECMPPGWYSTMVERSVIAMREAHRDEGQWPPEQWLFSAMFEAYPQLFQALPLRWHRHCSEADAKENKEVLENAMYMHYCGTVRMDEKAVAGPILTDDDLLFTRFFISGLDKIFNTTIK